MRKITEIIVHCSATVAGKNFHAADINSWHLQRGFRGIGYHYVIDLDGTVEPGRPEYEVGAHCLGHNRLSIGICYIGGLDAHGRPADTRTPQQKRALRSLIADLKSRYPGAKVHGHREFAAKACPCFDAAKEFAMVVMFAILLLCSSCHSAKSASSDFVRQKMQIEDLHSLQTARLRIRSDSLAAVECFSADSLRLELDTSSGKPLALRVFRPKMGRRKALESRQISSSDSVQTKASGVVSHSRKALKKSSARNSLPLWPAAFILLAGLLLCFYWGKK